MGIVRQHLSRLGARIAWPLLRAAGEPLTWQERWHGDTAAAEPVDLWIHSASIGEIRPYKSLLHDTNLRIGITVTSGRSLFAVQDAFADIAQVRPLPIPSGPGFAALLQQWQPQRLVLLEAEAWPAFLDAVPDPIPSLAVLAGRVRFPNTWQWRRFFKRVEPDALAGVWVADAATQQQFERLGCQPQCLHAGFHPKLLATAQTPPPEYQQWRQTEPDVIHLVAGSIHKQEVALLCQTKQRLDKRGHKTRWLIAPRHQSDFRAVAGEFRDQGCPCTTWPEQSSVTLVEQFGILAGLYALADVALVGGAWADKGGHTPVEAAVHGKPVITGPNHHNQAAVMAQLPNQVTVAATPEELADQIAAAATTPEESSNQLEHRARQMRLMAEQALQR